MHLEHIGCILRALREVWRDLTSSSHMRMFHIPTHWNVITSSGRPTPQINRLSPCFLPRRITHQRFSPSEYHISPTSYWCLRVHICPCSGKEPSTDAGKRCWERDRSAALGCSQSTKWDCDPSRDTKHQTKQKTESLLTFSRINRNPDSCHWTADVEKSRE